MYWLYKLPLSTSCTCKALLVIGIPTSNYHFYASAVSLSDRALSRAAHLFCCAQSVSFPHKTSHTLYVNYLFKLLAVLQQMKILDKVSEWCTENISFPLGDRPHTASFNTDALQTCKYVFNGSLCKWLLFNVPWDCHSNFAWIGNECCCLSIRKYLCSSRVCRQGQGTV